MHIDQPETSSSRSGRSTLPFKAYYFCGFAGFALSNTYLNLYFKRNGLSEGTIGELSAILSICGVLSPPVWGALADWMGSARKPNLILMAMTGALFPFFLFTHHILLLFMLAALFGSCMSPIIPLTDAAVVSHLKRWGGEYGPVRVWGSIGFVVALVSIGFALPAHASAKASALMPVFVGFTLWRMAGLFWGFRLPEGRRDGPNRGVSPWRGMKEAAGLFRNRRMFIFILCSFLGWASMQAYYVFFTIYLDWRRVPDGQKGMFWNVGVVAEILFLSLSGRVRQRIGYGWMLTAGLMAQALRLLLFSFMAPLWAVALGQSLHAFTFGSFYVAGIAFLHENVPDRLRAGGQAFFTAIVTGLGGALGAWGAGTIAHAHGLPAMYRECSFVAMAACLLSLLVARRR
ncbi:MAG: MFS transporter [Armatimonadota bacterium]|nr:MFS transporter [Armatimonadota bacterium]